jgi:hypothetical protein
VITQRKSIKTHRVHHAGIGLTFKKGELVNEVQRG